MAQQEPQAYTISQVSMLLNQAIAEKFLKGFWIVGEIKSMRSRRGHYYLELVETNHLGQVIAKLDVMIWSSEADYIFKTFKLGAKQDLEVGLSVMFFGFLHHHELYGLKFHVKDINPTYTLGDSAKKREQLIRRLSEEGIFDKNKRLKLPVVIQRIAVISSKTAAGLQDFIKHLDNNEIGIKFKIELFEAFMQGQYTEQTVLQALSQIDLRSAEFDVVVIVRGGGSNIDLTAFDSEKIARAIADFPLPVLTGIGHTRDRSITDMAAHTDLKTPTDVADFIITHDTNFVSALVQLQLRLEKVALQFLSQQKMALQNYRKTLEAAVNEYFWQHKSQLNNIGHRFRNIPQILKKRYVDLHLTVRNLEYNVEKVFKNERTGIQRLGDQLLRSVDRLFEQNHNFLDKIKIIIEQNDPVKILKQGFTISLVDGKILQSVNQLQPGKEIETWLVDGKALSKTEKIIQNPENDQNRSNL